MDPDVPGHDRQGRGRTNGASFANRVDALYGNDDWRRIQGARDADQISAADYRDEM